MKNLIHQNGKGRKIVKYEESDSPKSWRVFMSRNYWTFCQQNRVTAAKIAARFDSIRSRNQFFRKCDFHHFARKIETVNPFSMSFSPTRSWHLDLSQSIKDFKFQLFQNNFPEPHMNTQFSKPNFSNHQNLTTTIMLNLFQN